MSYRTDAYVPPPAAPRRGLSPWAYIGIGCLALVLLVFGAIGVAVYRFSRVFNQPVDKATVMASIGDIPVYPGAKFDETTTRAAQAIGMVMGPAMGGKSLTGAGFHVPATPEKVLGWYDTQMATRSYVINHTRQSTINEQEGQTEHQYFKKGEMVMVMVQPAPADSTSGPSSGGKVSMMFLIRVQGINKMPAARTSPAAGE